MSGKNNVLHSKLCFMAVPGGSIKLPRIYKNRWKRAFDGLNPEQVKIFIRSVIAPGKKWSSRKIKEEIKRIKARALITKI